jgi:hypothetical protein
MAESPTADVLMSPHTCHVMDCDAAALIGQVFGSALLTCTGLLYCHSVQHRHMLQ